MKELFKIFKDLSDALAKKLEKYFSKNPDVQPKINLLLLIVAMAALLLNISTCVKVYSGIPINERASRSAMAAASSCFYDSGPLEPLPVFALKIPMAVSKAAPEKIQRAEGVLFFVLIFFAFIKVLSAGVQKPSALYGAVILAGVPWMGYYAMTGSAILFSVFFLLFYWDYSSPARLDRRRALYAGLFASMACLCRTESIFFLLINTLFFLPEYKKNKAWKHVGVIFGMALLLCFPYAIWQKLYYGNAFYGQEMGLTRLINAEILNKGSETPLVEGSTGLFSFVFRDGFLAGLAEPFKGLIRALSFEFPRAVYYKMAMFLAFLGFYFAFMKKNKHIYSLWLSAFIPVCFIADMNIVRGQGGIPLEYYLPSLPGIMAAAGYGLQESCNYIAGQINKKAKDKYGGEK